MSKYVLTGETKYCDSRTLYRIRATRDIHWYGVKAWDYGGWVSSEHNLSQEGDSWIADEAIVGDTATVCDNALVSDNVKIFDEVHVSGNSRVINHAFVSNRVKIGGSARVSDYARLSGDVRVSDFAHVGGNANVSDFVQVVGNALMKDNAQARDQAIIRGNIRLYGDVVVTSDAILDGYALLSGNERIGAGARIKNTNHVLSIGPVGSENSTATIYRTSCDHRIIVGCWGPKLISDLAAEVERRNSDEWEEYSAVTREVWMSQYDHIIALGIIMAIHWHRPVSH